VFFVDVYCVKFLKVAVNGFFLSSCIVMSLVARMCSGQGGGGEKTGG